MSRTIKTHGNVSVTVVTGENIKTDITADDAEMDKRAREAVKSAISRAKICKKPVARYDKVSKRAYLEMADGEKIYVK